MEELHYLKEETSESNINIDRPMVDTDSAGMETVEDLQENIQSEPTDGTADTGNSEEEYQNPKTEDEKEDTECEIEESEGQWNDEMEYESEEEEEEQEESTRESHVEKEKADSDISDYRKEKKAKVDREVSDYWKDEMARIDKKISDYRDKEMKAADNDVSDYKKDGMKKAKKEVEEFEKKKRSELSKKAIQEDKKNRRRNKADADTEIDHYRSKKMKEIDSYKNDAAELCERKKELWKDRIRGENLKKYDKDQRNNIEAISEIRQQVIDIDKKLGEFVDELVLENVKRMSEQFLEIYKDIEETRRGYVDNADYKENYYLQSFADNLEFILEQIDDCMQNVGILSFESKAGDKFDPEKHEYFGVKGSIVARSIRKGFEWHNTKENRFWILQKELVEVKEDKNACRN